MLRVLYASGSSSESLLYAIEMAMTGRDGNERERSRPNNTRTWASSDHSLACPKGLRTFEYSQPPPVSMTGMMVEGLHSDMHPCSAAAAGCTCNLLCCVMSSRVAELARWARTYMVWGPFVT